MIFNFLPGLQLLLLHEGFDKKSLWDVHSYLSNLNRRNWFVLFCVHLCFHPVYKHSHRHALWSNDMQSYQFTFDLLHWIFEMFQEFAHMADTERRRKQVEIIREGRAEGIGHSVPSPLLSFHAQCLWVISPLFLSFRTCQADYSKIKSWSKISRSW